MTRTFPTMAYCQAMEKRSAQISPEEFLQATGDRLGRLARIGRHSECRRGRTVRLSRPLLAEILAESSSLEEVLDAYGARRCSRFMVLRELTAAAKTFARIGYILLHLRHSSGRYRVRRVRGPFWGDTDAALVTIAHALQAVMARTLREIQDLGVPLPDTACPAADYVEQLPKGVLPADRPQRQVGAAEPTVLHLATAFLELAARGAFLHAPDTEHAETYPSAIPDPISEESLRQAEQSFHNLQSMYDTYVADTETEQTDPDLLLLRGHVTVIFHLLEAGTLLTHFYERHILLVAQDLQLATAGLFDGSALLRILFAYCIRYASRYLEAGRDMCQELLRHHAHIGEIELAIPPYRGFHVRPSTLVAKIVRHYGSDVQMTLFGHSYDAGAALELFRANEQINAVKRQHLAEKVANMPLWPVNERTDLLQAVRKAVLQLAQQNEIVIYRHPLHLDQLPPYQGGSMADYVLDQTTHLLATGKIGIESQVNVRFRGDTRVLADVRILAQAGYGEDRFGNNVPLPPELSYLDRN